MLDLIFENAGFSIDQNSLFPIGKWFLQRFAIEKSHYYRLYVSMSVQEALEWQ
jgi:hypothetical protein